MRLSSRAKDVIGTGFMFLVLVGVTCLVILVEYFLENFKAH